jgi:ABC-2 type transport system permease protein
MALTATTAPPRSTTQVDTPAARPAVTLPRVMRAEWIKLRSVPSTTIGFLAAAALAILLGLIFSSVGGNVEGPGSAPGESSDPVSLSLAGFSLAQIVVGVLGVLVVAGEYSTGLIRTTFAAVTARLPVLWAKVAVVGAVTLVVTGVAALVAFVGGQAVYGGADATASLGDPGVLRAVLGTAVYCTGVALIGVALGFLMRSTASAIGLLFAGLLVVPGLAGLLPESVSDAVLKVLPSNAGEAFTSVDGGSDLLSPAGGLIVFALWVIGLLAAAAVTLRATDA